MHLYCSFFNQIIFCFLVVYLGPMVTSVRTRHQSVPTPTPARTTPLAPTSMAKSTVPVYQVWEDFFFLLFFFPQKRCYIETTGLSLLISRLYVKFDPTF